jgi:hypothetical protein
MCVWRVLRSIKQAVQGRTGLRLTCTRLFIHPKKEAACAASISISMCLVIESLIEQALAAIKSSNVG